MLFFSLDCCRVVCCNFYTVRVIYTCLSSCLVTKKWGQNKPRIFFFLFKTKETSKNRFEDPTTHPIYKAKNAQTSDKEDDCCARWNFRVDDDDNDDDASIRRAELLF